MEGLNGWSQVIGRQIPNPPNSSNIYNYRDGLALNEYNRTVKWLNERPKIWVEARVMTANANYDIGLAGVVFYKVLLLWGQGYGGVSFIKNATGYFIISGEKSISYKPYQWYKVAVYSDLYNRKSSVWVDDELMAGNIPILIQTDYYPEFFALYSDHAETTVWFDDIKFGYTPQCNLWNCSWQYRKAINITENSGKDLVDYPVNFTFDVLNMRVKEDCSDLRFIDSGKELSYWIESCNSTKAKVWVKVNLTANEKRTVYVYYSNLQAESKSNGGSVFEFFDDFNGNNIDESKWTMGDDTVIKESGNGYFHLGTSQYRGGSILTSKNDFLFANTEAVIRLKSDQSGYRGIWWNFGNLTHFLGTTNHLYTHPSGDITSHNIDETKNGEQIWDKNDWSETYTYFTDTYVKGVLGYNKHTIIKSRNYSNIHGSIVIATGDDYNQDGFYIDYVLLKKYADPEPTVQSGDEEKSSCLNQKPPSGGGTVISVVAPLIVSENSMFNVSIVVDYVSDFSGAQFNLSFNSSVVQVIGHSSGDLTNTGASITNNTKNAEGKDAVLINNAGASTGSGSIILITFKVVGLGGSSTHLNLSNIKLSNSVSEPIPVAAVKNAKILIISIHPGDSDGDGTVDIFDVIWAEKIAVGLPGPAAGNADADCCGKVDIFDVIWIEKMAVGLPGKC